MRTVSRESLGKGLGATLNGLGDGGPPVVVTDASGKPFAVLMSIHDFADLDSTGYLLSTPANAERLRQSLAAHEAGELVERTLDDLQR